VNDKLNLSALVLILFTVTVASYCTAFNGDFHYDDSLTILENLHVARFDTFIGHLDHMVRPVLYATFLIDRSLYGLNPVGYHLLNLMLHLGSGFLLYRILTNAVRDEAATIPFWAALIFLIHPIATETVTYISGRASGLMAFFYLLALYLYIRASQQPNGSTRLYLSGAAVSFLLSIGSKETAVTFPVILLLWDGLIRGKRGSDLRAALISHHLPFWILLLLAAAWAWSHPRYMALAQVSLTIRPFWDHLLSQVHVVAYSIQLFFTPSNQNFDHDLPVFHSLTQWPLPLDLLLVSGLVVASIVSARRLPPVAFGLGWFFVQLLPTTVIPRNDLLSERNLYLPAIGLLLAVVMLGWRLTQWLMTILQRPALGRFVSAGLAMMLVFVLCLFTYQRNLLYQDRLLLWSDAVRKSPNKARPHNNLGYAYSLHGDWDRAIEEFRTAAQLDPDYVLAQENLRDAYLHRVGRQ
jgi:tetratricopeptide (TPR) repeat protein